MTQIPQMTQIIRNAFLIICVICGICGYSIRSRKLLTRLTLAGVLASTLIAAPAARAADVKMDEETKKSVARGLDWLASKQNADGSWSEGRYPHNTAITAFALLAFMSQGNLPGQGQYGPEVAKGARFLISAARSDGYLIGSRGGNMYCHAMATL